MYLFGSLVKANVVCAVTNYFFIGITVLFPIEDSVIILCLYVRK